MVAIALHIHGAFSRCAFTTAWRAADVGAKIASDAQRRVRGRCTKYSD